MSRPFWRVGGFPRLGSLWKESSDRRVEAKQQMKADGSPQGTVTVAFAEGPFLCTHRRAKTSRYDPV